ncbi:MAG: putative GTP-binding protein EngB [Oligoflexia bacterium]|nr:MAG: putative GTP-binding protein EngB [Oligoflexia bacterium]
MPLNVQYLISCVEPKDYPAGDRPEIAIAGRSNAGKSSFINAMTGSNVAHVSKSPGKTRLLSFFNLGKYYRLVDMPGYGFASRSGDEVKMWQGMIETYLSTRESLVGLILVMDIRREWTTEEALLVDFMNQSGKPTAVVLTKTDKLSRSEILKLKKGIEKASQLSAVFCVSNLKKDGVVEVEEYIFENWIKPNMQRKSK